MRSPKPSLFASSMMGSMLALLGLCIVATAWSGCQDVPSGQTTPSHCLGDADCAANASCRQGSCVIRTGSGGDGGVQKDGIATDTTADTTTDTTADTSPDSTQACTQDETRPCYTIDEQLRDKGLCKPGQQTCNNGAWGKCIGEIKPSSEICDNGEDEDCDGAIDEDCGCQKGDSQPCGSSVGECQSGFQLCKDDGTWSDKCEGAIEPTAELCDGKDNDCDGQVDEDFTDLGDVCTSGKGECQATGKTICAADGASTTCDATPGTPSKEVCDDKDNDCDGFIDNKVEFADSSCDISLSPSPLDLKGECAKGKKACLGGKEVCTQVIFPQSELCNGKDDDCDGMTDENGTNSNALVQSCYTGMSGTVLIGNCKEGTQTCTSGAWGACKGEVTPTVETCDGTDEDCNGQVDDKLVGTSCSCTNDETKPCGSNVGACKEGTITCVAGQWGACQGATGPSAEVCDGKDNDCNGQVDDITIASPQACTVQGKQGPCAAGQMQCVNGAMQCVQVVQPRDETCDGKDTNCDGKADACQSGSLRCRNNAVERCKSDCEGWEVSQQCGNNQRCSSNQCINCNCTPGARTCGSNRYDVYICRSDCSGYYRRDCRSGEYCSNGQCTKCNPGCTYGSYRCNSSNDRYIQQCGCFGWFDRFDCRSKKCHKYSQGYGCR